MAALGQAARYTGGEGTGVDVWHGNWLERSVYVTSYLTSTHMRHRTYPARRSMKWLHARSESNLGIDRVREGVSAQQVRLLPVTAKRAACTLERSPVLIVSQIKTTKKPFSNLYVTMHHVLRYPILSKQHRASLLQKGPSCKYISHLPKPPHSPRSSPFCISVFFPKHTDRKPRDTYPTPTSTVHPRHTIQTKPNPHQPRKRAFPFPNPKAPDQQRPTQQATHTSHTPPYPSPGQPHPRPHPLPHPRPHQTQTQSPAPTPTTSRPHPHPPSPGTLHPHTSCTWRPPLPPPPPRQRCPPHCSTR